MSLLSDFGSFLNDVQHINGEIDAVKQDLVSGVKDAVMNIESQGKEVTSELQASSDTVTQTTQDISRDIQSQLKG